MLHLPKALNRVFAVAVVFVVLVMAAACPQPTPQGGEKVVTQVVEKPSSSPQIVVKETVTPASQDSKPQTAVRAHDSRNETPVAAQGCDGQDQAIHRQ